MTTRVRASVVDRTATGGRVCHVIGPLALRSPEAIDDSFRRVASQGPMNRIGLQPFSSREWTFDPGSPTAWSVRRDADSFNVDDANAELSAMMGESAPAPISITLKGAYALINCDHGIGDGHFMLTVPTLLAGDDGSEQWPQVTTVRPIRTALSHALRRGPRQLMAGFTQLVSDRVNSNSQERPVKTDPLTVPPTVVSAVSEREFTTAVRTAQSADQPASIVATIVAATTQALRRNGIEPLSTAGVVVDLRRYLPENAYTLTNFMSWVDVSTADDCGPAEIHRQLQSALNSYRPLIHFSVGSSLQAIRREIPAWTAWDVASTDRARLAFSDFRVVPAIKRYAWADTSAGALFRIALPLGFRDQISVAITAQPHGIIELTASFYDSAFDAMAIRTALIDALRVAQ
jgi:hypothetical protein